jgi:hypothetical protein
MQYSMRVEFDCPQTQKPQEFQDADALLTEMGFEGTSAWRADSGRMIIEGGPTKRFDLQMTLDRMNIYRGSSTITLYIQS